MIIKSSIKDYSVEFVDDFLFNENDFIIADSYFKNCSDQKLRDANIFVDASESNKEYTAVSEIIDRILKLGFKKNRRLVAVGGGVIQDIVGFIASILYRGVEWELYPTTLLSMGDSCIGGKTSINFGELKNQIGTFHPPSRVWINTRFLQTLEYPQLMSGFGEMLHYWMLDDSEDLQLFTDIVFGVDDDPDYKRLIALTLSMKKKFIELDEFDKKERQLLNFGHTFGHAIESLTGYKTPHGIAVAHGMMYAFDVSCKLDFIKKEELGKIFKTIRDIVPEPSYDINKMVDIMLTDKKNTSKDITVILSHGRGKMFKHIISKEDLKEILATEPVWKSANI
jgi:3-dehydroquinate synthase